MPPTIRDADTAILRGPGDFTRVGHFYLDVPRGRLHCLNEVARQLRADCIPLLHTDPARRDLRTLAGEPVTAEAWPLAAAVQHVRLVEAEFTLARPGQPPLRLQYSVTPMQGGEGRVAALLVSVVCVPPPPDWAALAGLAHDLRTPLQSLATLRHIVEFRTLPEGQRQDAVERLAHAAERAQKIAQDLLEWCRTRGTARGGPRRDWFALEPLLREIVAEQTQAAALKRLVLEAALDSVRGWQACTDRGKLGRILANLLVNAVRYTPDGGHVVLSTAWEDQDGGRVLVLEVRDTGAGIAADEQESIFNPFERGQSGRDGDATGSGVGLAVVHRLTQDLGLGCDMHSVAGEGSQFRILLPPAMLRMAPPAQAV